MVSTLDNDTSLIHAFLSGDFIHQPVILAYSSRPITFQGIFQGFWFSGAFERVLPDGANKVFYFPDDLFIGVDPVGEVFPGVFRENDLHRPADQSSRA